MAKLEITKIGKWRTATEILATLDKDMRRELGLANKDVAEALVKEMKQNITKGRKEWPKLSGLTVARKGHARPLINTRRLLQSIKVKKSSNNQWFAGIPNSEKGPGGISMVLIGYVQEYGATIRPNKAKRLAIPVSKLAMKMLANHGSIEEIPGLFRPKGTSVLAIKRRGQKNTFTILFILKKAVKIRKRQFMAPAVIKVYGELGNIYEKSLKKPLMRK